MIIQKVVKYNIEIDSHEMKRLLDELRNLPVECRNGVIQETIHMLGSALT